MILQGTDIVTYLCHVCASQTYITVFNASINRTGISQFTGRHKLNAQPVVQIIILDIPQPECSCRLQRTLPRAAAVFVGC